jgi:hypothetical protein
MNEDQRASMPEVLATLTNGSLFDRDLVTQLAGMVEAGATWPEGEPDNTVRTLLHTMSIAQDEALWRIPHATFQALLLELATRWQDRQSEVCRDIVEKMVSLAVDELKQELRRFQEDGQRSQSMIQLALGISLPFSAISSSQLAHEFIETIRELYLKGGHCMGSDQENFLYMMVKGHDMFAGTS